jgi:hypothetical protein
MADAKPKKQLSKEEIQTKFAEVTAGTIDDQATFFLRSFVSEFAGNFEEVLLLAEEFRKYTPYVQKHAKRRDQNRHERRLPRASFPPPLSLSLQRTVVDKQSYENLHMRQKSDEQED